MGSNATGVYNFYTGLNDPMVGKFFKKGQTLVCNKPVMVVADDVKYKDEFALLAMPILEPPRMFSCVDCDAGSFQPKEGATQCNLCSESTFTIRPGMEKCATILPGSYGCLQNVSAAPVKKGQDKTCLCQEGYRCPGYKKDEIACTKGFYQDEIGQKDCKRCSGNGYSDVETSTECKVCPSGSYTTNGKEYNARKEMIAFSDTTTITEETLQGYLKFAPSMCKACPTGYICSGDGSISKVTPASASSATEGGSAGIIAGAVVAVLVVAAAAAFVYTRNKSKPARAGATYDNANVDGHGASFENPLYDEGSGKGGEGAEEEEDNGLYDDTEFDEDNDNDMYDDLEDDLNPGPGADDAGYLDVDDVADEDASYGPGEQQGEEEEDDGMYDDY